MKSLKIAPSMMCADFLRLQRDLDVFAGESVDYLHVDIMDGHYAPNFTLGPDFCRAISDYSRLPLDIHLMIEDADHYLSDFAPRIPGSIISFHPETCYHPLRTAQAIKKLGVKAGIAVDPAMPLETIKPLLSEADMVCIMTVSPGHAGQKLIPQTLYKLAEVSDYVRAYEIPVEIEVDGNVSWENIPKMIQAGAQIFVAGTSSLFDKQLPLEKNIRRFRSLFGQPVETCENSLMK